MGILVSCFHRQPIIGIPREILHKKINRSRNEHSCSYDIDWTMQTYDIDWTKRVLQFCSRRRLLLFSLDGWAGVFKKNAFILQRNSIIYQRSHWSRPQ